MVVDGDPDRVGEVIGVPHDDGSPPYVVRWRRSGHIALVSPDSYYSIIPAGTATPASSQHDSRTPGSSRPASDQAAGGHPGGRR